MILPSLNVLGCYKHLGGAHLKMKILWTLMECFTIPNSPTGPTAILLGFNLSAKDQQNACSGKPKHLLEPPWNPAWNSAGSLEHSLLEPCWKVAQILPEPCWSRARTLLEPCRSPASWNLAGTLLESHWKLVNPCWNMVKPCWNLAGTLLLEPLAGTFCWEPMRVSISFFYLH